MNNAAQASDQGGDPLEATSSLYAEFLAEKDEILRHKWLESEKAGRDIGFERALLDWIRNHRANWRAQRRAARA
ncbi:MAG: DUF4032 domain-containing protein [Opitutales bacterium]